VSCFQSRSNRHVTCARSQKSISVSETESPNTATLSGPCRLIVRGAAAGNRGDARSRGREHPPRTHPHALRGTFDQHERGGGNDAGDPGAQGGERVAVQAAAFAVEGEVNRVRGAS